MRAAVPLTCVLSLAACDELLFGSLLIENPRYCTDSSSCAANEFCDPALAVCLESQPDMAQGPPPSITAIVPRLGSNRVANPIVITGSDFRPGVRVTVGDQPCAELLATPTRLSCTLPAQPRVCTPQDIVVENHDLTQAISPGGFAYVTPSPTFVAGSPATLPVSPSARYIVTADLNRDGKFDLVTSNQGGHSLSVFLGGGDGAFGAPTTLTTAGALNLFWVAAVDA